MKFLVVSVLLLCFYLCGSASTNSELVNKKQKTDSRQMEYVSLINTLLQQTNVLSSVDGVLLAVTTALSSLATRFKPFFIASALSYLIYAAMALIMPASMARFGLPTMEFPAPQMMGRSVEGSSSVNFLFDNVVADAVVRSIQISPVMNIVTNVSVNVITDAMARIRIISRMMVTQLSMVQGNMVYFTRMLSNECVSRFLCRVGQFTEANFPTASSMLRSLADTYPDMDDFAVAIVRGTSSSNCSLIYPDCIV